GTRRGSCRRFGAGEAAEIGHGAVVEAGRDRRPAGREPRRCEGRYAQADCGAVLIQSVVAKSQAETSSRTTALRSASSGFRDDEVVVVVPVLSLNLPGCARR